MGLETSGDLVLDKVIQLLYPLQQQISSQLLELIIQIQSISTGSVLTYELVHCMFERNLKMMQETCVDGDARGEIL